MPAHPDTAALVWHRPPAVTLQLMALGAFPLEGLELSAWLIHPAKDSNGNSQYLAPGVVFFFHFIVFLPLLSPPAKFRGYLSHGGMFSETQGALACWTIPHCSYPPSYKTTLPGEDPAGELVPSVTPLSEVLFTQVIFPLDMQ